MLAREREERAYEAFASNLLGDIAASRVPCDFAAAEHHYTEALTVFQAIGVRCWLARCHLGLGALYRKSGKREAAATHLAMATTMLAEMGMRHWLDQAEAEIRELG
jgi:hypothetical protein